MKTLGNIIWIVFGGLHIALEYFIAGLILMMKCTTKVFCPTFGVHFKITSGVFKILFEVFKITFGVFGGLRIK